MIFNQIWLYTIISEVRIDKLAIVHKLFVRHDVFFLELNQFEYLISALVWLRLKVYCKLSFSPILILFRWRLDL